VYSVLSNGLGRDSFPPVRIRVSNAPVQDAIAGGSDLLPVSVHVDTLQFRPQVSTTAIYGDVLPSPCISRDRLRMIRITIQLPETSSNTVRSRHRSAVDATVTGRDGARTAASLVSDGMTTASGRYCSDDRANRSEHSSGRGSKPARFGGLPGPWTLDRQRLPSIPAPRPPTAAGPAVTGATGCRSGLWT